MDNTIFKDESIWQQNKFGTKYLMLGLLEDLELEDNTANQDQDEWRGMAPRSVGDSAPSTPDSTPDNSYGTDEVSPTSTSISSIFDTPSSPVPVPFWYKQATPILSPNERQKSFSNASAITTWDHEDDKAKAVYEDQIDPEPFTLREEVCKLEQQHLDHDCGGNPPEPAPYCSSPRSPSPLNSRPRPVFITSCYQCILAKMSCSRTLPVCLRCERKGYGDLCLLFRRKLAREMTNENIETNNTPVLLRVEGMEEEKRWRKKLELSYEFQQLYLDQQDRNNWVLPSVSGTRGGFLQNRLRRQRKHPGEGMGRQTYHTLTLLDVDPALPAQPTGNLPHI